VALNTVGSFDDQYMPHNLNAKKALGNGELALNAFGRPEGYFIFGKPPFDYMVAVDLDLNKVKQDDGSFKEIVVGVNLLCPKCSGSLYVHGKHHPSGREIVVHWDKMNLSEVDNKRRPPVSIIGMPLSCDYSWGEINGMISPRSIGKCGWRGVIEMGVCYEARLHVQSR